MQNAGLSFPPFLVKKKKSVELNGERHFSRNIIQPSFSAEIAAVLVLRKINAAVAVSNSQCTFWRCWR